MLVSTPPYLSHALSSMYARKYTHEIGKERYHPRLRLGPAVVLGPADCDRRRPSSKRLRRVAYSSTFFRSLTCPLNNIFFMPRQMVDMKARESVGGLLLPEGRIIIILQKCFWRRLGWGIFRLDARSSDYMKVTIISTGSPFLSNKYPIVRVKDRIW